MILYKRKCNYHALKCLCSFLSEKTVFTKHKLQTPKTSQRNKNYRERQKLPQWLGNKVIAESMFQEIFTLMCSHENTEERRRLGLTIKIYLQYYKLTTGNSVSSSIKLTNCKRNIRCFFKIFAFHVIDDNILPMRCRFLLLKCSAVLQRPSKRGPVF